MEIYDTKSLAQLLGVAPSTIRTLKMRGKLPEPTFKNINGGPAWTAEDIDVLISPPTSNPIHTEDDINPSLPTVIDLFCGCGGMSLGFENAGFQIVEAIDNWKAAIETYNLNFKHSAKLFDLSNSQNAIEFIKSSCKNAKDTIIIGGPPCQDFSSAGNRIEGSRADLTRSFSEIVTTLDPKIFIMENVERASRSKAFSNAVANFKTHGYEIEYLVVNASRCGVPQRRKRLITIGSKDEEICKRFVDYIQSNYSKDEMTLRDYFGDALGINYYYRHPRSYSRRGVFSIDEPSPTIRGVNRPIPQGYLGHPGDSAPISEARPLTTRERASVQTFPPEFQFHQSKTDNEQLIGNAVPVMLANYLANALVFALKN